MAWKTGLAEDVKEKMFKMYEDGVNVREIAREIGVASSTVHRNLNRYGVKSRVPEERKQKSANRLTPEAKELLIEMYKRGDRVEDIAKACNCSKFTVNTHAKKAGLLGMRDVSEEAVNDAIQKYLDYELSIKEILRQTGLSKATFYRRLREYAEKQEG